MATMTMTFDLPESQTIDKSALKKQVQAFLNIILSMPSAISNDRHTSVINEFKGKWKDENITAEEFVQEIRRNREQRL